MTGTMETGPGLTRRRAETRDRLMDAAIGVFARSGVDQARVEDISEEAGYTRGAFYSNFTDKDDLILALLHRQITRVTDIVQHSLGEILAAPRPDDFRELISGTLDSFAEHLPDDDWLLAEQGLRLYALRNPTIAKNLRAYEAQHRASLAETLASALANAGMQSSVPMDHLVAIAEAIHVEAMVRERSAEDPADAAPTARDLLISFLESCLTPIS